MREINQRSGQATRQVIYLTWVQRNAGGRDGPGGKYGLGGGDQTLNALELLYRHKEQYSVKTNRQLA